VNSGAVTESLARRPGFLLSRVGTAIQAGFKEVLGAWRLRPLHFLILLALRDSGEPSQQDLCRALGIDSGNMVELVDLLEELRYAERARDPNDRRRYLVRITPEGRSAVTRIMSAVEEFDRQFLEPLSREEQRQLARLLAKLYAATAEARGEGFVGAPPSVDEGQRQPDPSTRPRRRTKP
jgi:MarR family transcriptional regulator, lower aerobic nicotinate degradation pathway regulator